MAHRTSEHDLSGRKNSPLNSSACPFETQASAADACSLSLQLQCMQCSTCMQHACMASFSCLREGHRFRITTTVSPSTDRFDAGVVPRFMHFEAGQYTAPRVVSRGAPSVWRQYTYMHHTTTHDISFHVISVSGEIIRLGGLIIASRAANLVLFCVAG